MSTRSRPGVAVATTALLVAAAMGCGESPPAPPALVGEHDAFSAGGLRPLHADAEYLYFHYSAADSAGPVPGPDAGVYRLALAGGTPTRLVAAASVLGVERSGDDLVMVTREGTSAQLVTLPVGGSVPASVPLTDGASIAATSSSGSTFVLASDHLANGRMSITRLAAGAEPEQVFAVRERAFVDGWGFHALDGDLHWIEGDEGLTMRLADDQSQAAPDELRLPRTLAGITTTGSWEDERYRLLGTIGGELYASVYHESFFATGGSYDDGDPMGYTGFGGGAVYTVAADAADARVVAVDVVQAVIAGDTIYGQNRDGDMVRIDPATGVTTRLAGHAPTFHKFTRPVVNGEFMFFADEEYDDRGPINAIRFVSLAPRD